MATFVVNSMKLRRGWRGGRPFGILVCQNKPWPLKPELTRMPSHHYICSLDS